MKKNLLIVFLTGSNLALGVLALDNPRVKYFIKAYLEPRQKFVKRDVDKEALFLGRVIKGYYEVSLKTQKEEKVRGIEEAFTQNYQGDFLKVYSSDLEYLIKRKGKRTPKIKKILRNKENKSYTVFLSIDQKIPEEIDNEFMLELRIELGERVHEAEKHKITSWKSKILTRPTEEMLEKSIFVESGLISKVDLPCASNTVSTIENKNEVELKLLPGGRGVRFKPSSSFKGESRYRARCRGRSFDLELVASESKHTVFQRLSISDGRLKKRKLTQEEQLYSDIEKQLGIKIVPGG